MYIQWLRKVFVLFLTYISFSQYEFFNKKKKKCYDKYNDKKMYWEEELYISNDVYIYGGI